MNASEHLYVGLDQKVVPKMAVTTKSLKKELLTSAQQQQTLNTLQQQQSNSRLRKQSTVGNMSVLRRTGTNVGLEDSDSLAGDKPFIPAAILIDYNKLCDDIYICDWI